MTREFMVGFLGFLTNHRLTLDLWFAKDNRFLNPKSSYKRILMAPPCRLTHCVHAIKAQWKKNGAFILFTSFSLIILLFYSRGLIKRRTHAFVHVVHAFIVRLQKPAVILWMKVYRVVRVVSFTLFIAAFMLLFVHYKAAWIKERTLDRQKTHEL